MTFAITLTVVVVVDNNVVNLWKPLQGWAYVPVICEARVVSKHG